MNTFAHHTFLFFICKKQKKIKKLKPCIIFLPLHNYALLSVGVSHKILIKYIYIFGENVTKCGNVQGGSILLQSTVYIVYVK